MLDENIKENGLGNSYANLRGIAERLYKNKKNGVEIVLRETIANAIHACIMQKERTSFDPKYSPKIFISISDGKITIEDNGCGFSESDTKTFSDLAKENEIKKEHQLPSKGLGRLALVHFASKTIFRTVNDSLVPRCWIFDYPDKQEGCLPFFSKETNETSEDSGTQISVSFSPKIFENFANKYKDFSKLQTWILENFAYLLHSINDLKLEIEWGEQKNVISFENMEIDAFKAVIEGKNYNFDICCIDSDKTSLILVAHKLAIKNDRIKYDRQFDSGNKKIYIASNLFDENISLDGLGMVDLEDEVYEVVQNQINDFLDKKFQSLIEVQKKQNCKTLEKSKKEFPFLADFMPENSQVTGYRLEAEDKFIDDALKEKNSVEKSFWTSKEKEEIDPRLGKSSLFFYVKHREKILSRVEKALGDSAIKEDDFHELLTDKGYVKLEHAKHNLWLIDEKFSYFTEGYNAKRGEKAVDVELYSYMDADDFPKNVVLIELKRPTKAHDVGKMINQLHGYALEVAKIGKTKSGINFDVKNCRFYGYLIADRKDIEAEINSRYDALFAPIVYTVGSYEGKMFLDKDRRINFYITLLSTQDLLRIAKDRNKVLFDLLRTPNF